MSNRKQHGPRGSKYLKARRRRAYLTEALERRLVLSGAHDAALLAAIDNALQTAAPSGLAAWTSKLDDSSALGRNLPLAGSGIGAHYDPGAALKPLLNRLAPTYSSLANLAAGLEGSAGFGDGIAVSATRDNPDDLELDVQFNTTTAVQIPIAGQYGINLAVGGALSLTATLNFQLSIGAYWDTGSSSAVFYILDTNDVLQISTNVTGASLNSTGSLGVVDLNVTGGSASLSPAFAFSLIDQSTPGEPGRLTLGELNSVVIPSLVATTVTQAAPTTLTVNFNAALAPTAHSLTVSWADLTKPTVATSTLNTDSTLSQLAAYQNIAPTTYSLGLDNLVEIISQATTGTLTGNNPFLANLPLLSQTFGSVLNVQTLLTNALTNHTDSTTNAQNQQVLAFSTAGQLLTLLENLPGVGVSHASMTTSATDIRFTLSLPASATQSLPLSLGISSQLNLPATGTMNVTMTTTTNVTFGVNTSNQFFILDTGSPILNAALSATATINGATNLGFLGVTITNGTASITGSATLALKDPQTDNPPTPGIISSGEMTAANLNAMAVPTVSGAASASLPLTTNLAALSGVSGTLGVSWANITQPQSFTLSDAALTQYLGFNNITPSMAISGLTALPAVLAHAGDTTFLGENLAFLGSSVGGGVALSTAFQNVVNAIATIKTAQDLQGVLNTYLGTPNVTVSITANDIEFGLVEQQAVPGSLKWAFNVTEPNSGEGFQSTGSVAATGNYTANILFGLGFNAALSATDRFYIIPGATSNVSASFKVQQTGTIDVPATLGYLQVNIVGGSASLTSAVNPANNASLTVPFVVPGGSGTQITLTKLQANPPTSALGATTSDGKVQLTLPITGLPSPGTNPQIGISWANMAQPATVVVTPQNLGDLTPGSNYNATSASAGLQSVINLINGWSNLPLLNTNVPLVGSPLKSIFNFIAKGTSFFQAVITAGVSTPAAFDSAVQHAIADAGLDAGSVTLTPQADNNPSTAVFHYLLNFHYSVTGMSEPFKFGSNLFTLNGNVTVGVQFNANIEFGLDKTNGFYIVDRSPASSPEVSLATGVTATFNKIGGTFGPISYGVSNGTANVAFNLGLDLVSPQGAGGKIGPGDLANNIAAVARPEFLPGSGGTLDLPIGFYLGSGGPGAATEFKANWNPANPGAFYFGTGNSTNPADGFSPVEFELGDFVNGIIGPLIQNIEQYNPLPQKLIDLLNYQLPLINETPAQILGNVADLPGFSLLFQIADVITQLQSLTGGGTLNLSNYLSTAPDTGTQPAQAGQGGTPAEQSPFQSFLNELQSNYGISIPVLANPTSSIINILLGQNVTLIEFKPGDNGHVEVSQSLTSPQITIPIFSLGFADASVFAQIGGSVGFFANIDLGIDSSGLTGHTIDHSSNLLDGFFIGDQDHFQVGFEGQVFLNLGGQIDIFGFPLVQVYGRLGLQLDLGLHVNDVRYVSPGSTTPVAPPNGVVEYGQAGGDGHTTLDELTYLLGTYGLMCTLELGGQLSLFGGIGFRGPDIPFIGNIPDIYDNIGTIPIINFDIPCTPPPPTPLANIIGNALVMVPDSSTAGKHIRVDVYYNPQEQPAGLSFSKYDDNGTQTQEFSFAQLAAAGVNSLDIEGTNGNDDIQVDPNLTSYYNFQHITVNTGDGNDSLKWGSINAATSHLLGTTINAGNGNDSIAGTFAPDAITTGNGNSVVLGLQGNDTITVGDGNDTVQSGTGNDLITTGGGQSQVALGTGNNTVFVGNGGNLISGNDGNNTIHGGSGGDKYYLGNGANSILAGAGNDVIYVGQGPNYISTGAGNDQVFAGDGNNTIQGGPGNDQINAGQGNNNIYGLGNNTIKAGDGKDYVSAGPGNNIITLGNGDNKVIVGNGANFISTGRGQDIILAGSGPDTVQSGAGDDFISVGPGNDHIDGGAGTNLLTITVDGNFVLGNSAVSVATTAGSATVNFSNIQRLTVTGGPGNNSFDVSAWTAGPVIINGNGGTDTLVSSDDTNFVLTSSSLSRSDGTSFQLNGIGQAQLTGGASDNSFDVSNFTGPGTVDGGVGTNDYNRIIATTPGTYTLTNTSLTRSNGATIALAHINRATLPGGTSTVNSAGFSGLVDLTGGSGPPTTINAATDSFGRWSELGQSASNGGVSSSPGTAIEPAIAASASAQFVAWADNRGGTYQIYIAEHTAAGWTQLAGSAQGNGISNTAGNSRRPSITVDGSGNPIVAWTVFNGASSDIEVATYSPAANGGAGGWIALGNSLSAGGISGTGLADGAQVVNSTAGPMVAWLDRSSGVANVYVKQFSGGVWSAVGSGGASGSGISGSATAISDFALATDGTRLAVSWTQGAPGASQIYLKQYSGGVWSAVGGSASGNGLSNTPGSADQSSVAYLAGSLFVAWQAKVNSQANIAAATSGGGSWTNVSIDTPASAGNAVTRGAASSPQLFQSGGTLELVWLERRLGGAPSQDTEIYANRFNGTSFVRVLPGDASFNGIHWTSASVSALALSVDSTGRPFLAWGDNSSGSPQVYALGATFAIHNIYYVNDALTLDDSFTTAAGSATNTGTSPGSPLDSVQSVLSKYALMPGDIILVDSGTYAGFSLSSTPTGVLIVGSDGAPSTIAGAVTLTNAQGVVLQGLSMTAGLTVTNGTNVELANDIVSGLALSGGTGDRVEHTVAAAITLSGGLSNATIVNNTVSGTVTVGGATGLVMSGNTITGGLTVSAASAGTVTANGISGGGTVLNLATSFTGSIDHNRIFGGTVGVAYSTPALLNANNIYGNGTGVVDTVDSSTGGLGFVIGSIGNEIYDNGIGVNLTGLMQLQHVHNNTTGVTGSGTLGGATLDTANLIEMNVTGVNFAGTIQFNRIDRNNIGIQATGTQTVIHNLIYRNVTAGIDTGGAADVRVFNNTFYSTTGNNVQVDGGSSNVQVLDSILWATGGYDISVADNSRTGFFSDYNDLYTTGTGKIVHWLIDFTDVLDWQVGVNRFDLHSIGTAAVNPTWAQPQFANLARDNFQVNGLSSGLRASSPTLDTADPMTDTGLPASYVNLLTNPSFESGVTSWTVNVGATTQSANPTAFNGTSYFYSGAVGSGFAQQTISLTSAGFTAAQLDGQGLVAVFGGRARSAAESIADQGQIVFTFLDGSNNPIGAADTVTATNASDRWELIGDRLHIPVGARSVTYRFQSLRESGSTDDSYLDNAFLYVLPSTTAPDVGAYGNTASDVDLSAAHIHILYPDFYVDWDLSTPHNIQWSTFGGAGSQVNIDLYQDNGGTPQFLLHIAANIADTGSYSWIPQNSGLTYGTYGLRVQVSLASNAAIFDRSQETFTIPENGHSYYVNDSSQASDVYTTALGNNRNDGKLPGKPKPMLTSLLRIYNLGGADTVFVDTGTYFDFDPVVLSGNPAIGKDQGVTITGPTNPANVAQINTLGFTAPAVFDIDNGNFVILNHLTINGGDYGVWARDTSSHLTGTYLTLTNNGLDGLRLEADSSSGAVLDHLTAFNNGRDGISIGGTGVNLTNSIARNNANAGIRYDNSGGVVLTANQSYLNKYGLLMTNSSGPAATVGNADLTQNLGNIFHDNALYGVYASGPITVAGNTVFDTAGRGGPGPAQLSLAPTAGQYLSGNSTYYYRVTALTALGETISSPEQFIQPTGFTGVALSWTAVPGAVSYNVYRSGGPGSESLVANVAGLTYTDTGAAFIGTPNPGSGTAGIYAGGGASATENVVYTNYEGIYSNGGAITNNRVFDTAGTGIYAANSASATGNVTYSNMVGIEGDSSPNWSNNLIYADSVAGIWLHSGFAANIFNNTIYQPAGDGIRIESSGGNFQFQHVNVRNNIVWTQNGYDLTVTPQAEIGFQSDYNDLYVTGNGHVGLWESVSRANLRAWQLAGFTDPNSISADPLFVNPSGADALLGFTQFADHGTDDDFHEQSTAGSFHGGSLSPLVNGATGLPTLPAGTLTPDLSNSPAIDRGDPTSSFANEPSPNGGFINLGAFGNTAQASETFIPYVRVLSPNGGEFLVEGETFTIVWRSEVATGTATIDLTNGNTVVQNIASNVANNGSYAWNIPTSIAPGSYTLRVTRTSPSPSSDTSDAPFTLSGPVHTFYVNDAAFQAGDFTTAAGDDVNNSGLDPAHPKASIRAILQAYNLLPGDVIDVDAGTYSLSSNIVIPANRPGIIIRGFYNAANPTHLAVINRNSTTAGSFVFDIQGAVNVTLDRLSITGADVGINASTGAGSTGLTVSNCNIYGNLDYGIALGSGNNGAVITGNQVYGQSSGFGQDSGIYTTGVQSTISNNQVHDNPVYGIYVQNGSNSTISGNVVYNNSVGLNVDTSTISGNIVHNNLSVGIVVGGNSTVTGNSTYSNTGTNGYPQAGIQVYGGTVQGNISYGNLYGIFVSGAGNILNNLLYGNTTAGATFGNSTTFNGNVVYNNGWGVTISSAPNAAARGPGLSNNLLYGNTNGGINLAGGDITPIVNNTIYQTTGDAIDITGAPYSTQVDVRNNILWVSGGYDLRIDPGAQSGVTADFNDLYVTGAGKVGSWQNVSYTNLSTWQLATLIDANSISVDPLFVNAAGGDFHEQSLYGSFHGGSLAPVLNASRGLPVPATSTLTNDASQSPTIDRGDSASAYSNEPAPNGGYVNLGAYGNTTQASRSPTTYMLVTQPSGGQNWIEGQTFNVTWRDNNAGTGLIDIDLMLQNGGSPTVQTNIVTGAPNNGHYAWTPSTSIPAGSTYLIRVSEEGGGPSALSPAVFSLSAPTHVYYVNDANVQPGDWTTAPGNDANSGIDPAHPKASIAGVLSAYTLGSGDTIKVDRGVYNLNGDIMLTAAQSGIRIVGFTGPDNSAGWSSSVLSSTPTAYWRFGESSGTTAVDSSGNGRNATYVNGVTLGQPGALSADTNTSASFNGTNQYVALPSGFADFTGGFSYEFWAYPTAATSYDRFLDIANGPGVEAIELYRVGTSNDLGFNVTRGATFGTEVRASGALEFNKWQYFVVTLSSSGACTIYKNGSVVATGTTSVPNNITRTSNFIGRSNYSNDGYYAGQLDEAAIYNRVLSPAEISARYSLVLAQAVINRGNTGAYDFNFQSGANNITLDSLALTGASAGVYANYSVGALNDTVTNCELFNNRDNGILLGNGNSGWTITGNRVHDNGAGYGSGATGININGSTATITNNLVYNDSRTGITLTGGTNSTISGNTVYACGTGIYGDNATISNNLSHDNSGYGIAVGGGGLAVNNTVYSSIGTNNYGIWLYGGEARSNTVYNSTNGIGSGGALIDLNRSFHNANDGVYAGGSTTVTGNVVYSNATGIEGSNASNNAARGPWFYNNLVYGNSTAGMWVHGGADSQFLNNTVYQLAGDSLRIDGGSVNIVIRNNILYTQGGYDLTVSDDSASNFQSDYNDLAVAGTAKVGRWSTVDFPTLASWIYEWGLDTHSISADPQFVNPAGPDGILGYSGGVDHGVDDNFHLLSTSPTIDAGDPASPYFNEPAPNGSRINLGNFGNTTQADASPAAQSVQLTSPGNLQKLEAGHPYTVSWQTAGVAGNQPVLLMDAGGPNVGNWMTDSFSTVGRNTRTVGNTIDVSAVTNPAPQQVYQSYAWAAPELAYKLPVPDGNYTLRLHFMDDVGYIGKPVMNIKVNGTTVRSNYDLYADAGAAYKATALSFGVSAGGGNGLLIELVAPSGYATLSGIELTAANPNPEASPTANLQVSTNSGGTWTTIATNQPLDAWGRGSYLWTPTATTAGPTALLRVLINNTTIAGTSQPFAVYGGGSDYYVNDSSTTGDALTTAVGNNANSGKSPDQPLADIQAVLSQYNPGAGAIIHVDTGSYSLVHDVLLQAANSGMEIQGPIGAGAVINRANLGANVFTFAPAANNITLDRLSLTGASYGVYANYGNNAANDGVSNSLIFGNDNAGILVANPDPGWVITGNTVHDNGSGYARQDKGIDVEGSFATVSNNTVYNESNTGIVVANGQGGSISGNTVYANGTGIYGGNVTISNNLAHDNATWGIYADSGALATNNTAWRQTNNGAGGIYVSNSEVRGNVVYGNYNGIVSNSGNNTIDRNRVYSNTNFGISIGSSAGSVFDNLVYANSAAGIVIGSSNGEVITNNTVYQLVGDALRFGGSPNAKVRGNILWVEAGDDLNVSSDSQSGFVSDYNDLYRGAGASASVGAWGSAAQAQLSNWQAASSQDAHSVSADPKFVNLKGADQVLGYSTAGSGYDGGVDDNFYLSAGSPAIDHGYSWGPATDILGQPRSDDPGTPNVGSPDYVPSDQGSSLYALSGTAQNWRSYGTYFNYSFPSGFTFPFYDGTYTSLLVSTSGLLQFAGSDFAGSTTNSDAALLPDRRIAALWGNIRTDQAGNDIYVDTSVSGQIKFTWKATNAVDNSAVNFSIVLFSNGQIRFDYGAGNTNVTPTVGISMGDSQHFTYLAYDKAATLTNAHSILLTLPPGFNDIGAYEFEGSSIDTTPPTLTATNPPAIQSAGAAGVVSQIGLTFSKPLNVIDALAPTNYQLVGAGLDGVFGTSDDVNYSLTPQYAPGSTQVLLTTAAGPLPSGLYRLTVYGAGGGGIHDLSGNLLDGDANGTPGGNYVRTFTTVAAASITGQVFNDVNNNAVLDSGESGLAGWTVFIDANSNGTLDPGEISVVTDSAGTYVFNNLPSGSYVIRQVVPPGYARSAPLAAATTVNVSAGQAASGPVFGDVLISSVPINFNYLLKLAQNYGHPGTFATGDVNGDGVVNFADLLAVAQHYGGTLSSTGASAGPFDAPASLAARPAATLLEHLRGGTAAKKRMNHRPQR